MSGRDWDLRPPDLVLQLAPVALALFCLVLSQANEVVFWGFEEIEPGTRLSTTLMVVTFLVALAGARRSDLPQRVRVIGGVLAGVAGLAVLDENLKWHEWIGREVRREVSSVSREITWYTDDVIVLLGAIVGGAIVYGCIRYVSRAYETTRERNELIPYLAVTVAFAVAHGLLDILGHSHYMVDRIWPALSEAAADDYVERISYFEEVCKLWAEWFAILLMLKLLHRQRGPLAWSLLAATGSFVVLLGGLWGVDDPGRGIPSLTVGEPLAFLRNFHALFAVAWIWTAWIGMRWTCFGRAVARAESTGLLLVLPLAPVLGGLIDAERLGHGLGSLAHSLAPSATLDASFARHGLLLAALLLPGLAVGALAGQLVRRWPIATGIALAAGTALFSSWTRPSTAMAVVVAVTAAWVIASLVLSGRRLTAAITGVVLALAVTSGNAWWAVSGLTWCVFVRELEEDASEERPKNAPLLTIAAIQLALALVVWVVTAPRMMPNYEDWKPSPGSHFRLVYQPTDYPR